MTDKAQELIREMQENVAKYGRENTTTLLMVQSISLLQQQARELAAIGAGGVEPLRKCLHQIEEPASLAASAGSEPNGYQQALSIRVAQGWSLKGDKIPVLYTDEINGEQIHRDDVWLCTTEAFTNPSPPEGMVGGWIAIPGTLPEPGTPVLLDIGKKYPIRAMWVPKGTLPVGTDVDSDYGEYDEDSDTYYCPEGWYEWNEHDEIHWSVSDKPLAWVPLPALRAVLAAQGGKT